MNQFLTINQVEKLLQIPKNTIYYYTSKKLIPHIRIGRHVRFEPKSLDKWLREKTKKVANN